METNENATKRTKRNFARDFMLFTSVTPLLTIVQASFILNYL